MQITWLKTCDIIFSVYSMPIKIVTDTGTNSESEKFENFCRHLSIHHVLSSSDNRYNNGQTEVCIKCVKRSIKHYEINDDICMALLQIRSTQIFHRLPSLVTFLLNRLTRGILPWPNRQWVLCDNSKSNPIGKPQSNEGIDTHNYSIAVER